VNLATAFVDRKRQAFARHLRGRGLAIGAFRNPMPLPRATEILFSDILTAEEFERAYPGSQPPDIISDSERFPTVEDGAFDFVVANSVLEHMSDPIRALQEWHRILRDGGLLMMAVPDKRFTFDHRRLRTPLAHLVSDHHSARPAHELNKCHLLEWAEHVERLAPGTPEFERWVSAQLAQGYSVHNHVWVAQDLLELVRWLNQHTRAIYSLTKWSNSSPLRGEFILLLRARKHVKPRSGPALAIPRAVALLEHPVLQLSAFARRAVTHLRRALASSQGTLTKRPIQKEPNPRTR